MSFELKVEAGDPIQVFPVGDLDINSASELKSSVLEAYEKAPADVVFDFSNLNYLDSTGLGALISVLKNLKNEGHHVTICHAKHNVRKLFTITELDRDFLLED